MLKMLMTLGIKETIKITGIILIVALIIVLIYDSIVLYVYKRKKWRKELEIYLEACLEGELISDFEMVQLLKKPNIYDSEQKKKIKEIVREIEENQLGIFDAMLNNLNEEDKEK